MIWNLSTPILSDRDFERLSHLSVLDPCESNEQLEKSLKYAKLYPCHKLPSTVVTMNSQVILQDMEAQARFRVTLVYPFDADVEKGKISVRTHLGSRLLGLQVGNVFLAEAPCGGLRRLAVISVPYQPEAAGDFD